VWRVCTRATFPDGSWQKLRAESAKVFMRSQPPRAFRA
jgi:hypothetical protein